MKNKNYNQRLFSVLLSIFLFAVSISAQTTAFTYQGRLTDSTVAPPTSGTYNMQFALFNALSLGTQSGATLTFDGAGANPAAVNVSNGIFTVNLDFGAIPLAAGENRWLEIRVFNTATSAYVILMPRQPLTAAPYSFRASSAGAADLLSLNCVLCVTNAQINSVDGAKVTGSVANAASATNAATAGNALNLGNVPASGYLPTAGGTITGSLSVGGVVSGNGSGLTNLPASGFAWQVIAGTTQQAVSGRGYVANNAGQVTITLPAAPNVGDVVRISGAGAGGWRIVQNAGQFVGFSFSSTAQFIPRENNRNWYSIASSADGTKLAAVVNGGQIYTSIDSGVNWTPRLSNALWRSIASSADGVKLAAVVNGGQIYTSIDSGVNWTVRLSDSNRSWHSIASSADGTKLAAVVFGGQIYTSTDSGVSWILRESNRNWESIASSTDGAKLAAVIYAGLIYTSTDSGVSWTARESNRQWQSIASSADGVKLAAVVFGGSIYTSTNSGVSWTERPIFANWNSIASSADGVKLAAVEPGGQIHTSINSGATWTPRESIRQWLSIASSADGAKLAAVDYGGQIYTFNSSNTTIGASGYLTGGVSTAVELQYVGGGKFILLSREGDIFAF